MQRDIHSYRKSEFPIEELLLRRWSPRAMSGEGLSEQEIGSLFEAARWAPSCYNEQPWRFLYARRDTEHWPLFYNLLMETNQTWAKNAGVLVAVISKCTFTHNGKPNAAHSLDTGSAWQSLALQATAMGLVAHGMAGFDYAKAKTDLKVPNDYAVEMMIALGRPGDPDELPEALLAREEPSGRYRVAEISFAGLFPG
ncbi:MAG: nitroreductase family protein [Gammaproteobacteria bacterium]